MAIKCPVASQIMIDVYIGMYICNANHQLQIIYGMCIQDILIPLMKSTIWRLENSKVKILRIS